MAHLEELIELRARIEDAQARRAALAASAGTHADVKARVRRMLDDYEATGQKKIDVALERIAAGKAGAPMQVHGAGIGAPGQATTLSLDLGGLLVAFLGREAVEQVLTQRIAWLSPGMTASERAGQLQAIDEELLALETAEEALIVELEAAGETVYRRADARPEIVLA